jgi:uncharacterized membrane protein
MSIKDELRAARAECRLLSLYQQFEYVIILVLTGLIAIVVVAALWNLLLRILLGQVFSGSFDPPAYLAFQAVFGMIFTVIVIALLAICWEVIILDLARPMPAHLLARRRDHRTRHRPSAYPGPR